MANRKILTLSLSPEILKEINKITCEEKISKSELFRRAVVDFIGRLKWEKASLYGRAVAQEMKITEEDIEDIVYGFRKK